MFNAPEYQWDEAKSASNLTKHGIAFSLVEHLDWNSALTEKQFRNSESRYITYAPIAGRLYVLIWTERFDRIRVISLRKANKRESLYYAKYYHTNR